MQLALVRTAVENMANAHHELRRDTVQVMHSAEEERTCAAPLG